jgi:hypothetical protein
MMRNGGLVRLFLFLPCCSMEARNLGKRAGTLIGPFFGVGPRVCPWLSPIRSTPLISTEILLKLKVRLLLRYTRTWTPRMQQTTLDGFISGYLLHNHGQVRYFSSEPRFRHG